MDLKEVVRTIPDFPEPGILFRDITPILHNPDALIYAVDVIAKGLSGIEFDLVVGPESRGFIFGVPVSYIMKKGFVPARKAGKLPYKTISKTYQLEYGNATVELHADAIKPGQRVVIVDDLLATGGTSRAIAEIIEEMGGEVAAMAFLIELDGLGGRALLNKYEISSVLNY